MDNFTFRKVEDDVASNVGLSDLERKEMRNLMDELDASRLGPQHDSADALTRNRVIQNAEGCFEDAA
jgi:hypothetical protein